MPLDRAAERLDAAPPDPVQGDQPRPEDQRADAVDGGRGARLIAFARKYPVATSALCLTVLVAIVCTPWLQTALGWGSLSWATYWTGIGAVGTTAALGVAAASLSGARADATDAREAEDRRRNDDREKQQDARTMWATSLDRRERLFAYRDLLIAQDARLTLLAARLKIMEVRDKKVGSPVGDAEALDRCDADLDLARQRAWAAMATIVLVSDNDIVTAATDYNRAVNKEIKAVQRAMTAEEARKATSDLSGKRGTTGTVFRDLTRKSLFDLPAASIDDNLASGRAVDDYEPA